VLVEVAVAVDLANLVSPWSARTARVAVAVAEQLAFLDLGKVLLAELAHGEASISEV
jgi:hypothetical protein